MQSNTKQTTQKQKDFQLVKGKNLNRKFLYPLLYRNSPLHKQYERAFHCGNYVDRESFINSDGNNVHSRFLSNRCKLRFCINCSRKRSLELYLSYSNEIDAWTDKHFLTLTFPNVKESELQNSFGSMQTTIAKINKVVNQNRKRNGEAVLQFIVHYECTYNSKRNDYHPHVHCIVSNKTDAKIILKEWLFRNKTAKRKAQDLKKADENSTRELFKYFTKIISSKDSDKRIYPHALDNIFQAIKGKRTIVAYGMEKQTNIKKDYKNFLAELDKETVKVVESYQYVYDYKNYLNKDSGDLLCDYQSEAMENIIIDNSTDSTLTPQLPQILHSIEPVNDVRSYAAREHDEILV